MRSSRLLKYFEEYIKKIDMTNSYAKAKYFHSLKSMDLARNIANSLNIFTEEEIVYIELIALFHDIGNFEKNNYNFLDNEDVDVSMKSIEILFDEGLIRKITDDKKYDNLIKIAIYCHDKEGLPKNIDELTINVCNIMKDVHKLEELRMMINYPYIDNRINVYPSILVYNEFKLFRQLNTKLSENNADNILIVLSNLFGFNYQISYSIVRDNNYITKIISSLIFEDRKIEKFFKQIEAVLKNYLNKKLG